MAKKLHFFVYTGSDAQNREELPSCFVLPASAFPIGLTAVAPAAFALPELISEPNLPQSARPAVAYSPWDELVRKALDGDISSATEIGKMYAHNSNAPYDVAEAMRWLTRGADLGSVEARRELGLLLLRGEGSQKDPGHAASLLSQAADAGDAEAEAALGVMYAYGDGVPQDWALAVDWSRKAANQNNPWGQANYGLYLEIGADRPGRSFSGRRDVSTSRR